MFFVTIFSLFDLIEFYIFAFEFWLIKKTCNYFIYLEGHFAYIVQEFKQIKAIQSNF